MIETYNKLEKIVLPYLKEFRSDLMERDRERLRTINAPFLYGFSEYGTHLVFMYDSYFENWFPHMVFDSVKITEEKAKETLLNHITQLIVDSQRFLHFDGSEIKHITKDIARKTWIEYVGQLTHEPKKDVIRLQHKAASKATECVLEFGLYRNGTVAIVARNIATAEPYMKCTVNWEANWHFEMPYTERCKYPSVVIKDYSENEGLYRQLVWLDVIRPGWEIPGSNGGVKICALTDKWKQIAEQQLQIKKGE